MKIGMFGVDSSVCLIRNLETVYLSSETVKKLYKMKFDSISSVVLLETCNRVEFYFEFNDGIHDAISELSRFIVSHNNVSETFLNDTFLIRENESVMTHLYEVVCGLKSMVFGENEILGQVKKRYHLAQEHGVLSPLMNKVFQTAIAIGKRARTDTDISKGAYSISSIALECIREVDPIYLDKKILVVGSGTMGQRVVTKLVALGHSQVFITNRTNSKAKIVAEENKVSYVDYSTFRKHILDYDIVIFATSCQGHILGVQHLQKDYSRSLILVDLGVPRNVEPILNTFDYVNLIGLDGFKEVVSKTLKDRSGEADKVKLLIQEESSRFHSWLLNRR